MASINRVTREQGVQDNPFIGMPPDKLDEMITAVKGKINEQQQQRTFRPTVGGVVNEAVSQWKQEKGYKDPNENLNDLIMRERVKQYMDTQRPKTSAETLADLELQEIARKRTEQQGQPSPTTDNLTGNILTDRQTTPAPVVPTEIINASEIPPGEAIPQMYIQKPKGRNKYGVMEYDTVENPEYQSYQKAKQPDKISAAAEKRAVEEQKLADELGGLLKSFERAKTEAVGNVGGFGAIGLRERFAGAEAGLRGKAGYLPAINVYNAQRNAFATVVAKAAGEIRPTDEDIRRFVATLPDTGKSDEENVLLISDIQEKVAKGGIANLWFTKKVDTSIMPSPGGAGQGNERQQAKQILLQKGYSDQQAEQLLGQ